jgi:hypothetical protein
MAKSNPTPKEEHAPVPKYLVPAFVAAMVAWGLYLGIGAAFPERAPANQAASAEGGVAPDGSPIEQKESKANESQPRANWQNFRPWRGIVVIVCTAVFLAWFWGLQRLYLRRHSR